MRKKKDKILKALRKMAHEHAAMGLELARISQELDDAEGLPEPDEGVAPVSVSPVPVTPPVTTPDPFFEPDPVAPNPVPVVSVPPTVIEPPTLADMVTANMDGADLLVAVQGPSFESFDKILVEIEGGNDWHTVHGVGMRIRPNAPRYGVHTVRLRVYKAGQVQSIHTVDVDFGQAAPAIPTPAPVPVAAPTPAPVAPATPTPEAAPVLFKSSPAGAQTGLHLSSNDFGTHALSATFEFPLVITGEAVTDPIVIIESDWLPTQLDVDAAYPAVRGIVQ